MQLLIRRAYPILLSLAATWVIVNSAYVYLVLHGDRAYRIESAAFILALLMLPVAFIRGQPRATSVGLGAAERRGLVLAAIAAWLATLLPLAGFPFLSDDYGFLELYRGLGDVGRAFQFYRPGFAAVFVVLARIGGGSPVAFHLASLSLHLLSSWLVFSLARRLFERAEPAIICFTIFLLSPIQLEAVLWISGLQDLLWTFFVLAALRVYAGARELRPWPLAGAVFLAACGLASKETAVCFVLLLPAADLLFFGFRRGPLLPFAYAGFAVELAAYWMIRRTFVSVEEGFLAPPSQYFIKQFFAIPYKVFLHPWNQSAVHAPPVLFFLMAVGFVVLLVRAGLRHPSSRWLSGPAVIAISTLPLYTFFFVGPDLGGSRYLYFAAAGWSLLVAEALVGIAWPRAIFITLLVAVVAGSAVSLQLNLNPWRAVGELVDGMREAAAQGRSVPDVVREWEARHPPGLVLKDGIPRQYEGVGIFVNGYEEFVRLAQAR